LISYFYRYRC